MNTPFSKYKETISNQLKTGKRRRELKEQIDRNFSKSIGSVDSKSQHLDKLIFSEQTVDESYFNSLAVLSAATGKVAKYHEKPGAHPDFLHIKEQNTSEYHYIATMFIDIRKSTELFRDYAPLAVANITTTIHRAAIHASWYFDAFIQRFHGDGLMIYFGDRSTTMTQAAQNALNAASYFTNFVKNDLKDMFFEQGVEDIYTRIGIDIGNAEDVLWYLAGMGDCSEITTCSLHTSLPAHMQSNASPNGIMVGDNIKQHSLFPTELYSIKKDSTGNEDRYIFRIPIENFNYTQWIFNWERYLKQNAPIKTDNYGNLLLPGIPAIVKPEKNMDYLKRQVQGYKPYSYE